MPINQEFLNVIKKLTINDKKRQISRPLQYKLISYAYGNGRKDMIKKTFKKARELLDYPDDKVRSWKAFKDYSHNLFIATQDVYNPISRAENIKETESNKFKSVAKEHNFIQNDINTKSSAIIGHTIPKLLAAYKDYGSFKVSYHFTINYSEQMSENLTKYGLILQTKTINNRDEIFSTIALIRKELMDRITEQELKGTGFMFDSIASLRIAISKNQPFKAGSYIELPEYLTNKKCCINIQNKDDKCLMYCVLYHIFKLDIKRDPQRVSKYEPYLNHFDWSSVTFPVKLNQLCKIEEMIGHGINIFFYENKLVSPLRITNIKDTGNNIINLLMITKLDNKSKVEHFVYISKLDVLVSKNQRSEGKHINEKSFTCCNCLHGFKLKSNLEKHKTNGCDLFEPTRVELPKNTKVGDEWIKPSIKFKNFNRAFKAPVVIYADFETLNVKTGNKHNDTKSSTTLIGELPPCSYGFNVVSDYDELNMGYFSYVGDDAVKQFISKILEVGDKINHVLSEVKDMIITDEQEKEFKKCEECHICKEKILNDDKVRDHDHVSGLYIGCAHNSCNLNRNHKNYKVPVYFHNMKGFDGHLIIQGLKDKNFDNIDVIAQNFEKYMCLKFSNLMILDSFSFLASSLDTLSANLLKDGKKSFVHTLKEPLTDEQQDLILKKGVFPYDYIDSFERLNENKLPSKDKFYSSLDESGIKEEAYNHGLNVWNKFNMKTLKDYHDLYLKTDILLLTDVFESFRISAITNYGLDPANGYFTLPNYAWDALLKLTGVELEQLTDIDMYLMVEQAIRGGISLISHRHAEANNKYMADYDKTKETSYIMYLDANNLYGEAMSHKLPTGGFQWVENVDSDYIVNFDAEGDEGIFIKCDLEYPKELHDIHNNYPLAPESRVIDVKELSPYQINQCKVHEEKHNDKIKKLVPNLYNKKEYVVHIKNLQYYLSKGLKLGKIHAVLKFKQTDFLKPYIMFNTMKRAASKNEFEKDLYKLMNNAAFGKTMENVRNHVDISFFSDEDKFLKQVVKPQYESHKIYGEHLIAIKQVKRCVKLNKPIYVGAAVLDLSKLHMYKFHYDYIIPKYKDCTLLFTDTDSLCYHIKTDDVYKDMKDDIELFDQSDYNKDGYRCKDNRNKKVIGKFKDETEGIPIKEFVGLRSKMYSILLDGGAEKKRGKGIKKSALKRDVTHANYKDCLFGSVEQQRQLVTFNNLRSVDHNIGLYRMTKVGLSCSNDKQYLLDDGITSYSYGHYLISK
jgi:hypothetical protein